MIIITNNPLVQSQYPELTGFIDSGVQDVLIKVRDYIHLGAKLINHPLSGSLIPGVSPYISLIIEEKDEFAPLTTDFYSLPLIESTLGQFKEPPIGFTGYSQKVSEDYQVIDLDMVKNCVDHYILSYG